MIEGITIIETTIIPCATWGWSWLGFWLIFAALAIFAIGVIWGCNVDFGNENIPIVITSIMVFCCMFGGLFNFASATKLPDKIQHQILVDESVPFYIITQNYDIIEQKGNSYIVQEKRAEG